MEQNSWNKAVFEWLKKAPNWCKVVVMVLLAALAAIYLCTSCSTISRVQLDKRTTREIKDTTHLVITQSTTRTKTRYNATRYAFGNAGVDRSTVRSTALRSCVLTP